MDLFLKIINLVIQILGLLGGRDLSMPHFVDGKTQKNRVYEDFIEKFNSFLESYIVAEGLDKDVLSVGIDLEELLVDLGFNPMIEISDFYKE